MKATSAPARSVSKKRPSDAAQQWRSRQFKMPLSIPRAQLILFALGLLVSSSFVAFIEPLRPDPYQTAGLVPWIYPAEENAHKRLQAITCDLKAVCLVPGSNRVWVVGDRGLAAFSDEGRDWTKVELRTPEPQTEPPTVDKTRNASSPNRRITGSQKAVPQKKAAPQKTAPLPAAKFKKAEQGKQPDGDKARIASASSGNESQLSDGGRFLQAEESSHGPNPTTFFAQQNASPPQGQKSPDPKPQQQTIDPKTTSPKDNVGASKNKKLREPINKEPIDSKESNATDVFTQKAVQGPPSSLDQGSKKKPAANKTPPAQRRQPSTPAVGAQGAASIAPKPPLPHENFLAVRFADEKRGWILGHLGTLYGTNDGGTNWSQERVTVAIKRAQLSENGKIVSELLSPPKPQGVFAFVMISPDNSPRPAVLVGLDQDSSWGQGRNSILGSYFSSSGQGWAVGTGGHLFRTADVAGDLRLVRVLPREPQQNETLAVSGEPKLPNQDLWGVYFVDTTRGWVTGAEGTTLATTDGGDTWVQQPSNTSSVLKAVAFSPDARRGWAAGTDGTVISTTDGGGTWIHNTQGTEGRQFNSPGDHRRALPRWYYATLALTLIMLGLAALAPAHQVAPEEESVADTPSSDKPLEAGDPDSLDLNAIALGLSRFLRNENTIPPLTIAITGDWGTGKSSLMNLLKADLRRYKFRPVWFNAWHHQKEHNLLAALLQSIKLHAIPRWYLPRGLVFRFKLILIRARKHVIPVLALVLLFSFLVGYELNHNDTSLNIDAVARFLIPADVQTLLANLRGLISDTTRLGLLASLLGVLGTCWKGVTAFGVKPASLVAGLSGSVKLGELEAQTSFRQKFAGQFAEVTQALGVRTMPIFIDDLDRCRPDQALEVLEAVNFLVSSGECFVVLAMARPQVEACVGISFKEVAEEIGGFNRMQDGNRKTLREQALQRRREFARQYLDKLINIEVPVPAPTEDQSHKLLTEEGRLWKQPSRGSLDVLRAMLGRVRPLIAMAVIVSFIAAGGYLVGKSLRLTTFSVNNPPINPMESAESNQPQGSEAPTPNQGRDNVTSTGQRISDAAAESASGSVAALPTEQPRIIPPSNNSLHWGYWITALGAAGLLSLWFYLSLFQPDPVVKDSRTFKDALRIWHSVVYAGQSTPRAIKRFRNRVRYLAMRQRATTDGSADPKSADQPKPGLIPESFLVALASIQHLDPEWIEDDAQFQQVAAKSGPHPVSDDPKREVLQKAVLMHVQEFGDWSAIKECRPAYLKMSSSVRVR